MSSPWELPDGPCTLNVSGGRSSAMMLWHVLEYYDEPAIDCFCGD